MKSENYIGFKTRSQFTDAKGIGPGGQTREMGLGDAEG